jgi:hypothetical protein
MAAPFWGVRTEGKPADSGVKGYHSKSAPAKFFFIKRSFFNHRFAWNNVFQNNIMHCKNSRIFESGDRVLFNISAKKEDFPR